MKLNEFIEKLELALKEPSRYEKSGWGKWNGTTWGWDCCNLGKGIIWGWCNDKNKPRGGGAVYGSNKMPDVNETQMFNMCTNISSNFADIKKGEFVWLKGHIGYYVGNGYVIEATKNSAFKADGVIKSQLGVNGERLYNGKQSGKWLKHGFFPLIDYTEEPTPAPTKTIEELAQEVIDGKWGNNPYRKNALIEAGYDYRAVQDKVNELCKPKAIEYIVKKGDSLSKIGKAYGVAWKNIAKDNNVKGPRYVIYVGQKLIINK